MSIMVSPTEDEVMAALRAFILSVLPDGVEVVQGQNNRVAEPAGPDFVVMTPSTRHRLSTNTDTWDETGDNPTVIRAEHDAQYDCQLDFHGPNGSDFAATFTALFRDPFAVDEMASYSVTPLFANDGQQMPFINGEGQYENRWVMTVSVQIKPTVSTPMQFADRLDVTISDALGGA